LLKDTEALDRLANAVFEIGELEAAEKLLQRRVAEVSRQRQCLACLEQGEIVFVYTVVCDVQRTGSLAAEFMYGPMPCWVRYGLEGPKRSACRPRGRRSARPWSILVAGGRGLFWRRDVE